MSASALIATATFLRSGLLEEKFRVVPEEYVGRVRGDVTVHCLCGEATSIRRHAIKSCKCGRIFWNGQQVYAAPPPTAEDDWECCDMCLAEVRSDQGQRVKLDGWDSFVCQPCMDRRAT